MRGVIKTILFLASFIGTGFLAWTILQIHDVVVWDLGPDLDSFALVAENKKLKERGVTLSATISYYTASKDETDSTPCITADGTNICPAREGIIAANWLPVGTKVKIDGKVYRVADRMNQRYQWPYMDVLVESKALAKKNGRQNKKVEILGI